MVLPWANEDCDVIRYWKDLVDHKAGWDKRHGTLGQQWLSVKGDGLRMCSRDAEMTTSSTQSAGEPDCDRHRQTRNANAVVPVVWTGSGENKLMAVAG